LPWSRSEAPTSQIRPPTTEPGTPAVESPRCPSARLRPSRELERLRGGAHGDTLDGGGRNDTLTAGGGDDAVIGVMGTTSSTAAVVATT
jgi:Ca2+-binding RTX toxin-like protein